MTLYEGVKALHLSCAAVSFALFVARGVWMMQGSPRLGHPVTRILPHAVDSTLLASAVVLAALTAQYPFVHAWITVKVVLVLAYIGLGMVGLKRGRTKAVRVGAWATALVVFACVVLIAVSKSADPAHWGAALAARLG